MSEAKRNECMLDPLVVQSGLPKTREQAGEQAVYTPDKLAADIVSHFRPAGRVLEPCKGGGAFLRALPRRAAAGAMKLSPAVEWTELTDLPVDRLEYVGEGGVCKQLVAWWGADGRDGAGRPARMATVVAGDPFAPESTSLPAGEAPYAPICEAGAWLVEPDATVVAARGVDNLAAAEGLWRLAAGLVWLSGDEPVETPLARSFRILAAVPGRERDVARALRKLDAGVVEIKPRGVHVDTDALQRRFRGRGRRRVAVLWGRLGQRQRAFLCERHGP